MFVPTLTALAAILALGQSVPSQLQFTLEATTPVVEEQVEVAPTALERAIVEDTPSEAVDLPIVSETPVIEMPAELQTVLPPAATPIAEPVDVPADPIIAPQREELSADQKAAILDKARLALGDAETAKGEFIQENSDGTITSGEFALRRPGRMRFDYDDPTPILIVSDGTTVAMEDSELETIDRIPLGSTPLGLILDDDLEFGDEIEVLRVNEYDDTVTIALSDATGEIEGELTMIFDKVDYALVGWLTIDPGLQTTSVSLHDVETNGRIDPRLFRLEEDEDDEDER